jgi:hypothetical protein
VIFAPEFKRVEAQSPRNRGDAFRIFLEAKQIDDSNLRSGL